MYRAVYNPNGETIYFLIQVDEFSLACSNEYVAKDIYVETEGKTICQYRGTDIEVIRISQQEYVTLRIS